MDYGFSADDDEWWWWITACIPPIGKQVHSRRDYRSPPLPPSPLRSTLSDFSAHRPWRLRLKVWNNPNEGMDGLIDENPWWRWWSIRRLLPWQARRPCASFKVAGAVADGLQGPWLRYYVAVSTRAWLVIECDCFSLSFTSLFFYALYVAETASLLCRFLL